MEEAGQLEQTSCLLRVMAGLVPLRKRFGGVGFGELGLKTRRSPGADGSRRRGEPGHPRTLQTTGKTWMAGSADKPGAVCAGRIAELLCPDMTRGGVSAAPHWRHRHRVAPAGTAVDFLAGAELHVLAHADPHLAQAPARADH